MPHKLDIKLVVKEICSDCPLVIEEQDEEFTTVDCPESFEPELMFDRKRSELNCVCRFMADHPQEEL